MKLHFLDSDTCSQIKILRFFLKNNRFLKIIWYFSSPFQAMQSVDTGSQVCNLAWSKHSSELVSTHGYSQNQILVWKYPSLVQVSFWDTFYSIPTPTKGGFLSGSVIRFSNLQISKLKIFQKKTILGLIFEFQDQDSFFGILLGLK